MAVRCGVNIVLTPIVSKIRFPHLDLEKGYAKASLNNLIKGAQHTAFSGGGEPLLNYTAINSIMELGASRWHTTVETSLNVPQTFLESIVSYIDEFIVDIKDMNPIIYKSYTGKNNNKVIRNLRWLVNQGKSDRITVRVPLIENFNTNEDRKHSCLELKKMGLTRFDLFKYITNIYD